MLQIKQEKIIEETTSTEIRLRGVNLGGWLMMEGYILGGRNITETEFKNKFKKINGKKALIDFENSFRKNFINEHDIKYIKNLNFNCIRVPFHWKIADKDIYWLKRIIEWCKKHKIYCILDMHSVPGSQNGDWHSDPPEPSKSLFWFNKKFHSIYYSLWDKISKMFKDEEIIAGYDIMNEPVIRKKNWAKILAEVYNNVIKVIRKNSDRHIIFVEGNMWASMCDFFKYLKHKENIAISIHFYHPVDYTFNLNHDLKYPDANFNKDKLYKMLKEYKEISMKHKVPIYVGEFGINLRCDNGCSGEKEYLRDLISAFEKFDFHWTIWTYKTIYIHVQPTGLLVYNKNPDFISRQENDFGWERYILSWKKYSSEIKSSWLSRNFSYGVLKILKDKFFVLKTS
ncbi:MAG: cellulase family glycosylhydrolase [Endomicrobiia bacterium]